MDDKISKVKDEKETEKFEISQMLISPKYDIPEGVKYVYSISNVTCLLKCLKCGLPKLDNSECAMCEQYISDNCHDCTLCVADRKYIAETSNIFEFIGFIDVYNQIQAWKCNQCNKCIAIKYLGPCMSRNIIWVKARKMHLDPEQGYNHISVCEMFKTGMISH